MDPFTRQVTHTTNAYSWNNVKQLKTEILMLKTCGKCLGLGQPQSLRFHLIKTKIEAQKYMKFAPHLGLPKAWALMAATLHTFRSLFAIKKMLKK